jgi:dTDP-4-dehydrorhamnose 3,5-epimerase-like enzyme
MDRLIGDVLAQESLIPGAWWTTHTMHGDHRGSMTEAAIDSTAFELGGQHIKQVNVSMSRQHVMRGMHAHKRQMDWWYIAGGIAQVVLQSSKDQTLVDSKVLYPSMGVIIPPMTGHGFLVLDDLALIYAVSNEYKDFADEWEWNAWGKNNPLKTVWRLQSAEWIISERDELAASWENISTLVRASI